MFTPLSDRLLQSVLSPNTNGINQIEQIEPVLVPNTILRQSDSQRASK